MIGLYGPILFHPGSAVSTFDGMKKTVTARWANHDVWLSKPLLEYSGPQLIEVSFRMELVSPFTVNPLGTIMMLEEIMDMATPLPLIIGMKPMGRGSSLFVLTSLSHEMKYFYRNGGLIGASVEVQLKEYPDTFTASSLMQALGGLTGGIGGALGGALGGIAGTIGQVAGTVSRLAGIATGVLGVIPGAGRIAGIVGQVGGIAGTVGGIAGAVGGIGASAVSTATGAAGVANDVVSGALPATLVAPERAAFNASVDKLVPALAQNAGNPVPLNLGFT